MTTPHAPEAPPFWGYPDLLMFLSFTLPGIVVAFAAARLFAFIPGLSKPLLALLGQALWYGLIFGGLALLFRLRYDQPFWASLGWKFPFPGMAACLIGGVPLAFAIGGLGYALHTPQIALPFDQMLIDKPTTVLFAIFVVVLGPISEELAFRGLLLPLLSRSLGSVAGILISAAVFGGIHAPEYQWSWRHALLVSLAGAVFGWVRTATRSTVASTFLHATFNLTQLAAFLGQRNI